MLGFSLDFWDYATFVTMALAGAGFMASLVIVAQIPGWIAIARNHPDAEAVKVMGWAGFLAVVPWIQAFIWAFKPTDIIDIRRFPAEERAEFAVAIQLDDPDQSKLPMGAEGVAAIYTGGGGFAMPF